MENVMPYIFKEPFNFPRSNQLFGNYFLMFTYVGKQADYGDVINDRSFFDQTPEWREAAHREVENIRHCLPHDMIIELEEIGSSSINGIKTSNNIEFMLVVDSLDDIQPYIKNLYKIGYDVSKGGAPNNGMMLIGRRVLVKTSTYIVFMYHQIFIMEKSYRGRWMYLKHFRDYLRTHPLDAKQYEAIKMNNKGLNPLEYFNSKTDFVLSILKRACSSVEFYIDDRRS